MPEGDGRGSHMRSEAARERQAEAMRKLHEEGKVSGGYKGVKPEPDRMRNKIVREALATLNDPKASRRAKIDAGNLLARIGAIETAEPERDTETESQDAI